MPQAHTAADVSYAAGDREETVVAAEIEQVPVAVAVVDGEFSLSCGGVFD